EAGVMQRTADRVADDEAFGERSVVVRAMRADGTHPIAAAHDHDVSVADAAEKRLALRQRVERNALSEIGPGLRITRPHGCLPSPARESMTGFATYVPGDRIQSSGLGSAFSGRRADRGRRPDRPGPGALAHAARRAGADCRQDRGAVDDLARPRRSGAHARVLPAARTGRPPRPRPALGGRRDISGWGGGASRGRCWEPWARASARTRTSSSSRRTNTSGC